MVWPGRPRVRMVATDLDGTLLRRDRSLSERTVAAVDAVAATGIPVVLVTARPPRFVDEIVRALPCHPIVVCSNGAFAWDARVRCLVAQHLIPTAVAAEAVRRLRETLPGAVFSVEIDVDRCGYEQEYVGEWSRPDGAIVAPAETLVNVPVAKVSVRHADADPWVALEQATNALVGLVEVTRSDPTGPIELLAVGVTKASGVEIVAERLGLRPSEVLALGDMPNDLPMLRWAGLSAAPANSHPRVLATVDRVLGDCDDDGVAIFLEELAAGDQAPEAKAKAEILAEARARAERFLS